jgi:hypothetical protein
MITSFRNEDKLVAIPSNKKRPLDVKIIVWINSIYAALAFLLTAFLITGTINFPSGYCRPVLFGLFHITSNLSSAIFTFLYGLISLISAYCLYKFYKFGWFFVFFGCLLGTLDSLRNLSDFTLTRIISICMSLGVICWLIYRRRLYKIGKSSNKVQSC